MEGQSRDKGYFSFAFEVAGNRVGAESGDHGPLPLNPSTGGILMDSTGPETAYVIPIDLEVASAGHRIVRLTFHVNTHESFRWQDEASAAFATGAFDATPTRYEPVRSFGANEFRLATTLSPP